jgi:16S rRNA (guanine966-N2)-methyltransferase
MFSSIEHVVDLDGARVLDLYAGSGALGLEAASRGATHVVCVDSSKKVTQVLAKNIQRLRSALGTEVDLTVVTSSAVGFCTGLGSDTVFDLVMMDPPYDTGSDEVVSCLEALTSHVTEDSVVVVERAKKSPEPAWPESFQVVSHKTYGDTAVYYLRPLR